MKEKLLKEVEFTNRGFGIIRFNDDYGEACTLQESSACDPHIWLGVHDPHPQIMCSDAIRLGIPLDENCEHYNGKPCGWQKYDIPEEVVLSTRMHLNPAQAKELAHALIRWANDKDHQLSVGAKK